MTTPATRLWPVTIIATRYGGTYEGGRWAAFNMDYESIPEEAMGSDIACAAWWGHFGGGVGVGSTPDEALSDLGSLPRPLQWRDLQEFMPHWRKDKGFEDEEDPAQ